MKNITERRSTFGMSPPGRYLTDDNIEIVDQGNETPLTPGKRWCATRPDRAHAYGATPEAAAEACRAIVLEPWKCRAKPVSRGGKVCGFVNTGNPLTHYGYVVCADCGCTKIASDARKARKQSA